MNEIDEKVDRLARLAATRGLGGILLNTQPNFSWLTGGRSNQIDGSRENGGGSLFVSARGERFVVANNIEMPRLHDEALAGLDFSACEYAWTDEQADSGNGHRARSSERVRRRHRVRQRPGRRRRARRRDRRGARAADAGGSGSVSRASDASSAAAVGSVCRALVPDLDRDRSRAARGGGRGRASAPGRSSRWSRPTIESADTVIRCRR